MPTPEHPPEYSRVADLRNTPTGEERPFRGVFMIKRISSRTGRNDSKFLVIEMGDGSGSFQFVCFDNSPIHPFFQTEAKEGMIVETDGVTGFYQERFSPKVVRVSVASDELIEESGCLEGLIETAPEDPQVLWDELMAFTDGVAHQGLRQTLQFVWDDIGEGFRVAPAALSMHHAYRHGLLEHTIHMARAAKALFPLYPEVEPDLAMAGILTHDAGKVLEYEIDGTSRRQREGILQGHVVLGYRIVRKAGIRAHLDSLLLERLEHIILSHQGELEWGAAAMAATPEAVFVSMVDNLDAKMGMVQYLLRQDPGKQSFSEHHLGLKAPLLLDPPPMQSNGSAPG